MNYLALLSYLPAKLTLNPIVVNVEAADPVLYPNRAGLRYYCRVMVPSSYLSNQYQELIRLEGAETPPSLTGTDQLFVGAFFEIQEQLNALLDRKVPAFNQSAISVISDLITPYYCILSVEYNDEEISSVTMPVQYAIKAGINEKDYSAYKDVFFTEFIGKNRRFLTWSPTVKMIHPDQPEFLYFFSNTVPTPERLSIWYSITYEDLTQETSKGQTLQSVYPFAVMCFPVGPKALGLDVKPKNVLSYRVWVSNQNDERITEVREYRLDPEYRRQARFILFANSLGGFDTLYLAGKGEESLKVKRTLSQRFTGFEYLPHYSEQIINAATGERELSVATAWLTKEQLTFLEELALTKEAFLVTDRAFVPLLPTFDSVRSRVDDEDLPGRVLSFRYANPETNYSELPNPQNLPTRATSWRPKATACLVDANGKRTGKKAATLLEQYYLDDHTRVIGSPVKANTPGTAGYIPPVDSADCLATPFVSAEILRVGTFKRQTCPAGQLGGSSTIQIPAGKYGSEISQADANAKAEAEFTRLNTQDEANANGSCTLQPEKYDWNIPAGYFHYRASDAQKVAIYWVSGGAVMGNSWNVQQTGNPNVYPQNSNDLNFPVSADPVGWRFMTYGPANGRQTYRVYVNGELKFERVNSQLNQDGYTHNDFPEIVSSGGFRSGDKLFIQVIDL